MMNADRRHYFQNWSWSITVCRVRQIWFPQFMAQSRSGPRWQVYPSWSNRQPNGATVWRSLFWTKPHMIWCEPSQQLHPSLDRLLFHSLSQAERFCMENISRERSYALVKHKDWRLHRFDM